MDEESEESFWMEVDSDREPLDTEDEELSSYEDDYREDREYKDIKGHE